MVNTRRTESARAASTPAVDTPTQARAPTPEEDLAACLEATNLRIQQLEQIKAAREKIAELEAGLRQLEPPAPAPIHPQFATNSAPKNVDIKIDDIPSFNMRFSIRKRHEWLINLNFAFQAAPRRYHNDKTKILGALSFMESSCRTKWFEYTSEKEAEDLRNATETWKAFEDWTLSLIQNATSIRADVRDQLEKACQLSTQDPRDFHTYLHSLEQHLERESEENRTLNFFAKLQQTLKDEIHRHVRPLPSNREEMVEVAVHYWNLTKPATAPKRGYSDNESWKERNRDTKRFRTSSKPQEQSNRFNQSNRTRYQQNSDTKTQSSNNTSAHNQNTNNRPKHYQNPTGRDGKTMLCNICKSANHFANNCPDLPRSIQALSTTESGKVEELD